MLGCKLVFSLVAPKLGEEVYNVVKAVRIVGGLIQCFQNVAESVGVATGVMVVEEGKNVWKWKS